MTSTPCPLKSLPCAKMLTPRKNLDKTFAVSQVWVRHRERKKIMMRMIYVHFVQHARNLQIICLSLYFFPSQLQYHPVLVLFFLCYVTQSHTLLVFPFHRKYRRLLQSTIGRKHALITYHIVPVLHPIPSSFSSLYVFCVTTAVAEVECYSLKSGRPEK